MDSLENAQAYADVDFSEPNSKFVAHFANKFPGFGGRSILDLGCGPGETGSGSRDVIGWLKSRVSTALAPWSRSRARLSRVMA